MSIRHIKSSLASEVFAFLATLTLLLLSLRTLLIDGTSTMTHDNLYWDLPIFHFIAESLMSGRLPLWDPFNNGGMAFYPSIVMARHLDPVSLLTILIGRSFTNDIVMLFHWARFSLSVVTLAGAYTLLRQFTPHLTARIALLPILFFSYFMIGSFRQPCLILLLAWVPWILYLSLRILHFQDGRLRNWLCLGALIGLNWQAYYFASTWLALLFLILGFSLFRRQALVEAFRSTENRKGLLIATGIVIVMTAPNLAVLFDQRDLVHPARMLPADFESAPAKHSPMQTEGTSQNVISDVSLSYAAIEHSGTIATLWSFLQAIAPDRAFRVGNLMAERWRAAHDGHIYLGLLTIVIALTGIFFGTHPLKRVFLTVLIALALTSLGPNGILHRLLYPIFPPLWFLRHTFFISLLTWISLLYFFILGVNRLLTLKRLRFTATTALWSLCLATVLGAGIALAVRLEVNHARYTPIALLLFGAIIFSLRRHREVLVVGIALALAGAACSMTVNPAASLFHYAWSVGVPALALLFLKRAPWIPPAVLLAVTATDFGLSFVANDELYASHAHPARVLGVTTTPLPARFPETREIYPAHPPVPRDLQAVRLMGALHRRAYALSTIKGSETRDFTEALKRPRWNSFYLPRGYFELINSSIPPTEMAQTFRIGKPLLDTSSGLAKITVRDYDYNSLSLEISAETEGHLYWADGYDRWWTATVDGQPAKVNRAKQAFKEIAFPKGYHRIEWHYRPWHFLAAAALYYLTIATALVMSFGLWLAERLPIPKALDRWREQATV